MCEKEDRTLCMYVPNIELFTARSYCCSQPFTDSVAFLEVDFSVGPSVSGEIVNRTGFTGVRGVAVVAVVVVIVVVIIVVVDVPTVCSSENPVLRKISALVTM